MCYTLADYFGGSKETGKRYETRHAGRGRFSTVWARMWLKTRWLAPRGKGSVRRGPLAGNHFRYCISSVLYHSFQLVGETAIRHHILWFYREDELRHYSTPSRPSSDSSEFNTGYGFLLRLLILSFQVFFCSFSLLSCPSIHSLRLSKTTRRRRKTHRGGLRSYAAKRLRGFGLPIRQCRP
jgi:hypothetical protein